MQSDFIELRAIEPEDVDFMYEVENDNEVWKYGDIVAPISKRLLEEYALTYDADPLRAGQLRLIAIKSINKEPVGIVDLYEISQRNRNAFVGIYILEKYRRKGYATEILSILEKYSFGILNLHQLAARVNGNNKPCLRLFENAGYKVYGKLKEWLLSEGSIYEDLIILSKLSV